ncbi:hypothetical protein BofuT4_uP115680.1 [Botrytis cinerea T4]|uniref:Uncharacterized protein n=1 Tax=Botryotinia fuckeliana (strain T4) TaxID=999810 RepID=G2Y2H2_BOTF4|nr:hypothetical protein BofuT4_uP115680.1 [Botrytis cinerea T4]
MDQKQKQKKKMILKFYVIILVRKTNMMIRSSFWLSKGYPQVISNTLALAPTPSLDSQCISDTTHTLYLTAPQ